MLGNTVRVFKSTTPIAVVVDPELATQSFEPSTEIASPCGDDPIGIVFVTVRDVVSMTITLLLLGTVP